MDLEEFKKPVAKALKRYEKNMSDELIARLLDEEEAEEIMHYIMEEIDEMGLRWCVETAVSSLSDCFCPYEPD